MSKLTRMGFGAIQVNVGWGSRPGGEPLNLEDVIDGAAERGIHRDKLRLNSDPSKLTARQEALAYRSELAHRHGLRTIFNVGIPYNRHGMFGDAPPNCIMEQGVRDEYLELLEAFAQRFAVDDLWVYTYDQDAWLCSEFGECPRCAGVPLHTRVAEFLDALVEGWSSVRPEGRIWWEPWELSGGQTLAAIELLEASNFGLALHNNSAEAMVAFAGDRQVKNLARLAASRGIPVIIEGFLGSASEEVEPFEHVHAPLAVYREVVAMTSIEGVVGVKEYYGLDLSHPDPNLEAAVLAVNEPGLSETEVLNRLSADYGDVSTRASVALMWKLASEAIETYPWDASWFVREVGRSNPAHSLNAAAIRGFCANTPAWRSTRGSTFMVTDDIEPHPWLLEDLQLRWARCASVQGQAIQAGTAALPGLSGDERREIELALEDLREFRRRALAYAFHCRESNLASLLRSGVLDEAKRVSIAEELMNVLKEDAVNSGEPAHYEAAISALELDLVRFLDTYFLPAPARDGIVAWEGAEFTQRGFDRPLGPFSATSR
ncbi:MAG: hypothetical protein J0I18_10445 [Actinobacteria bacterium]|nr:hypothetical protein [Actinomycetota bacterium]